MRRPALVLIARSAVLGAFALLGLVPAACRPAAETRAPAAAASPAGVHGLDTAAIDRSVDPGDDFYKFANGTWLDKTEIPADRSTWGPSEAMTDEASRRTRELLEEAAKASPAAGSIRQQAADYYA